MTAPRSRTGGRLLVGALEAAGVRRVFGLPGIQLDPFFDALHDSDRISLVGVRHEQAATYLADGYARVAERPGVAAVVPGPGVLNALAGLATAYACRTPVLLIAGQIERRLIGAGIGALHEIPDQSGVLRSLTRWHRRAESAAELPALVAEAMTILRSGTGPAALEVPADVLAEVAPAAATSDAPPEAAEAPEAAMASASPRAGDAAAGAVALVAGARRPVIVAGGGCRSRAAAPYVRQLAEHLDAPVVVTDNGKGALDARHPLAFERSAYRSLVADADVVLALGTRFANAEAATPPLAGARLVTVNTDPAVCDRLARHGVAVRTDVGAAADALITGTPPRPPTAESRRRRDAARTASRTAEAAIAPQLAYLEAIRRCLPEDGILVGEYTQLGYAASFAFPAYAPNTFIWPGYQGTLGYGFATAIGAALGAGGRPVVSLNGDGGFSWTLEELSTLRRYAPPLVTVVVNDGAYGNVRRIQRTRYAGREIGTDLTNPDYPALAEAFGVPASRATGPESFEHTLAKHLAAGGPSLIELTTGAFPSPWHLGMP